MPESELPFRPSDQFPRSEGSEAERESFKASLALQKELAITHEWAQVPTTRKFANFITTDGRYNLEEFLASLTR